MLRHVVLAAIAVLAFTFVTQERAWSAALDWGFEGAGEGWQVTGAAFSTGAPSHSGARAGVLVSTNDLALSLRASGAVPPGTLGQMTARAWFGGAQADFRDVALGVVFRLGDGTERATPAQPVALGEGWRTAVVQAALPSDTVEYRVQVIAGPVRPGVTLRVDDVEVVLPSVAASAGSSATASSTARASSPTSTAVATASATRTPTRTATPTATPTTTPGVTATAVSAAGVSSTVTNGDFEDARPLYGWSAVGGAAEVVTSGISTSRSAMLASTTGSTKWLQQAVRASGGAWYRAAAMLGTRSLEDEAFLRLAWYASADGSGSQIDVADSAPVAGGSARAAVGPVQAPAEARSVRVRLVLRPSSELPAVLEADDVELVAVEAPSSQATPIASGGVASVGGERRDSASPSTGGGVAAAAQGAGGGAEASTPRAAARDAGSMDVGTHNVAVTTEGLRITELMPDPAESGADGDYEWVELANLGGDARSLEGYALADNGGSVPLPTITLEPMGVIVVAASRAALTSDVPIATLSGGFSNGLGNAGDHLALIAPGGVVVDGVSWGADRTYGLGRPDLDAPGAGRSIVRRFADDGSFVEAAISRHPSPGSIDDSLAAPGATTEVETASAAAAASAGWSDRGWMLLLGVAVVALGAASVGRVREAWLLGRLPSMR